MMSNTVICIGGLVSSVELSDDSHPSCIGSSIQNISKSTLIQLYYVRNTLQYVIFYSL